MFAAARVADVGSLALSFYLCFRWEIAASLDTTNSSENTRPVSAKRAGWMQAICFVPAMSS